MLNRKTISRVGVLIFSSLISGAAFADDFYKGRQVTFMVGSGAGSVNDAYARLLARHLRRHIPGDPNIIVQAVPGASGVTAAAQLYNNRPRDGSVISLVQRTLLLEPLLSDRTHPYDMLQFNWLGSLNRETNVLIVSQESKVKTLEDAKKNEAVLAAAAPDSDGVLYPKLMNMFLGTKFKVVAGYDGDSKMMLSIERGETEGRGGVPLGALKVSSADKLRDGRIKILLQLGLRRDPEISEIPNLLELVSDPTQKQLLELLFARQEMGRPLLAPPGVPAERVALLRNSIKAATSDPEYLADAARMKFEVDYLPGEKAQEMLERLYSMPKPMIEQSKRLIAEALASK